MRNEDYEELLNLLRQYMEENALEATIQDAFEVVEKTVLDELSYVTQSK